MKDPRITADQALSNLSEWAKAGISIGDSGESVSAEKPDTTSAGGFPFRGVPQPADTGSQMPEDRQWVLLEAYDHDMTPDDIQTKHGRYLLGALTERYDHGAVMTVNPLPWIIGIEKEAYEQGMLDQAERDAEEWYGPDHE